MDNDNKFFGENGILSENGRKYYKYQRTESEKAIIKKRKRKEFVAKVKKAIIPSVGTAFGIAFALNALSAAKYGTTLVNVIGMSLVETPFVIPVGFIGYKVIQSVKNSIDEKLAKENKKIEEFTEYNEEKEKQQELEKEKEKEQQEVHQQSVNYEEVIKKMREQTGMYSNANNDEFVKVIMSEEYTKPETNQNDQNMSSGRGR